jgi:hypothetical protein
MLMPQTQRKAVILLFFQDAERPPERLHPYLQERYYRCCHPNKDGDKVTLVVTKGEKYNYKS